MKKTRTSALWTAALSAVAAAGLFASCDKTPAEPVTPPVVWPEAEEGLANQYQFKSAETVDIKSVVYDYSEDTKAYIFVFSTAEGAEEVEATLKNDSKAFGVIVPTLDGAVDTTKTWGLGTADQSFSVTNDKLTGNEHSAKLSFKLAEDGKLVASVEYIGETPDTYFFLKYEGACTKQYHEPTLVNQMLREDRKVTELKSLVVQTKHSFYEGNTLTFFFLDEEGINADNVTTSGKGPCLFIMLENYNGENEFSVKDYKGEMTVMAGDLYGSGSDAVDGNIKFEETDKGLSLEFNFSVEGKDGLQTVKAVYDAAYSVKVLSQPFDCGELEGIVPSPVFREETAASVRYVFGSNAEATTPEQLKEGDFAVSVTIPTDGLGENYEADKATACKVEYYDYKNYTVSTIDKDNLGKKGCVYVDEPVEDDKVLVHLENLKFADDTFIDGAAYSKVVDATIPDLTPVPPFNPTITITNEDGTEVLYQEKIIRMEVRHQPAYSDISDFTSKKYDGYAFYFVTPQASSPDEVSVVPMFVAPTIMVNNSVEENLGTYIDGHDWAFRYTTDKLSQSQAFLGYGNDGSSSIFMMWRCPNEATLTLKKTGKNWDFKFMMKDWGPFGMSYAGLPADNGSKNILTIEWHGPASQYTGDSSNDMTDQDY